MSTPNSTAILSNIVSTLSAITTGGGYHTTVAEVCRYGRNPEEAPKRPSLYVHKGAVEYSYAHGNMLRCTMTVTIFGHVYAATHALRDAAIEELLDDCVAALMVDPTRGGNAIDTVFVRSEDDVSDLPSQRTAQGLGSDFALEITVMWDRLTTSS
jgi:hypothetical protein